MDQSKQDNIKEKNNIIYRDREYSDLSTVESQKDNLIPEEFPEGPFGASTNRSLTKDTPYLESTQDTSAFTYENKELHEGLERKYPQAHPIDELENEDKEEK